MSGSLNGGGKGKRLSGEEAADGLRGALRTNVEEINVSRGSFGKCHVWCAM